MCLGRGRELLVVDWPGRVAAASTTPGVNATPQQLAESLVWKEGLDSPNGRRVLWVQPATRTLQAMTKDPAAIAFFAAGCPIHREQLAARLPDGAVEHGVDWPLTDDEGVRLVQGYRPTALEDKWRIAGWPSEAGLRVVFLRSWTGALIYVLQADRGRVRKLWAPKADRLAVPTVRALMDGYLFGKPCVIPAPPDLGEDRLRLMSYGFQCAGRWCDAVEPAAVR